MPLDRGRFVWLGVVSEGGPTMDNDGIEKTQNAPQLKFGALVIFHSAAPARRERLVSGHGQEFRYF
jgi:hypothetical protein